MRITDGEGVDVVIDATGPTNFRKGYRVLRQGGRLVMYGLSEASTGEGRSIPQAARQPRPDAVRDDAVVEEPAGDEREQGRLRPQHARLVGPGGRHRPRRRAAGRRARAGRARAGRRRGVPVRDAPARRTASSPSARTSARSCSSPNALFTGFAGAVRRVKLRHRQALGCAAALAAVAALRPARRPRPAPAYDHLALERSRPRRDHRRSTDALTVFTIDGTAFPTPDQRLLGPGGRLTLVSPEGITAPTPRRPATCTQDSADPGELRARLRGRDLGRPQGRGATPSRRPRAADRDRARLVGPTARCRRRRPRPHRRRRRERPARGRRRAPTRIAGSGGQRPAPRRVRRRRSQRRRRADAIFGGGGADKLERRRRPRPLPRRRRLDDAEDCETVRGIP